MRKTRHHFHRKEQELVIRKYSNTCLYFVKEKSPRQISYATNQTSGPVTRIGEKYDPIEKWRITRNIRYKTGAGFSPRNNIWHYNVGKGFNSSDKESHEHPAIFPEKLAEDHIISWSNEGDIVLDLFSGSGTTCKMAKKITEDTLVLK